MAANSDRIKSTINFPVELKEQLTEIAKQENRSLNNLIITILQNYVRSAEK